MRVAPRTAHGCWPGACLVPRTVPGTLAREATPSPGPTERAARRRRRTAEHTAPPASPPRGGASGRTASRRRPKTALRGQQDRRAETPPQCEPILQTRQIGPLGDKVTLTNLRAATHPPDRIAPQPASPPSQGSSLPPGATTRRTGSGQPGPGGWRGRPLSSLPDSHARQALCGRRCPASPCGLSLVDRTQTGHGVFLLHRSDLAPKLHGSRCPQEGLTGRPFTVTSADPALAPL